MLTPPTLTVLGVAQDGGHPQTGCERACCAPAWDEPSRGHLVTSLGLCDGDAFWLIDASPDLPRQLHQMSRLHPQARFGGVLLTHAHMGHYTGLMHLGRESMGARGVPVWAMPRMRGFLEAHGPWEQLVRLGNIALQPLVEGEAVELSPRIRARPLVVPHREEYSEAVGFLLEGPNRKALFLPDIDKWERWATPIESLLSSVDVALLDGTFFGPDELPGRDMAEVPHPFITETLARLATAPAEHRARVRFIHLNHSNPALAPHSEARRCIAAAGMAVAEEGEHIAL